MYAHTSLLSRMLGVHGSCRPSRQGGFGDQIGLAYAKTAFKIPLSSALATFCPRSPPFGRSFELSPSRLSRGVAVIACLKINLAPHATTARVSLHRSHHISPWEENLP